MPVPTETLWNTKKLNAIFVVVAAIAGASMGWMLWADYDRPWRDTQLKYFDVLAALAHFDVLGYRTPEKKAEHEKLKDAVASAERKLGAHEPEENKLLKEKESVSGRLAAISMAFGNVAAQIQVSEFNYNELRTLEGPEAPKTVSAKNLVESQRRELAELRKTKDSLEDRQRAIGGQLRRIYADRDAAQKALTSFEKGLNDAERRDEMYGSKGSLLFGLVPVRALFNIPGMDFTAPKGTPGREEIKQVVLPDVRVDLNFVDSYATDRCTTCHVGIDNPNMTRDSFAKKLEDGLKVVNAERVGRGEKPLEAKLPTATGSDPAKPSYLAYGDMSREQKDEYLGELSRVLNEYLKSTGRAPIDYGHPLLAHPDLDLYVSPDSPHPINQMGCTVCHEGNGQETDFVLASHTPANEKQEHEWAKKYYIRHAGLPETTFHTAHEFWERPMLLSKYTSASCTKCHSETADLEQREGEPLPSAEKIVHGRELFTQLGCINCHANEGMNDSRQVGPDLSHVGLKLTAGFMHNWIEFPKAFRPSTRMPAVYGQENNLPSSRSIEDPDPTLRTHTEIQAITHYLMTFTKPYTPYEMPAGLTGDAKRGEELFTSVGCLACHGNLEAKNPNDESGRSFGESWIVADLVHDGTKRDEAEKRYKEMSHNDRVEYAVLHLTPERRVEMQAAAEAEKRRAELEGREPDPKRTYIPGALTRFAPELGGMGSKLVPDPENAEQRSAAQRWLYDWLREPRHYSSYTKMPRMFRDNYYWKLREPAEQQKQNDQDMLDIGEYLLSLRNDSFKREPFPLDARHVAEAQRLDRMILAGQNTDPVVDAIMADKKLDPSDEMGMLTERVVKAVAKTYGEGEAGTRAALEIVNKQDLVGRQMLYLGGKMISHYGCYACHSIPGFEGATRPGTELTTWGRKLLAQLDFGFFADGFRHERERNEAVFGHLYPESSEYEQLDWASGGNPDVEVKQTHASFAYYKMRNPRIWDRSMLKKPYDKLKMPNFFLSPDEADALTTYLLSRQAPLVKEAVKIDYGDTPTGKVARGRHLVNELNCVGCHSIENNAAVVHQYYDKLDPASGQVLFDVTNAPPNLFGEGAKIQFPWLFGFLNNVEMLRPWLKIRMPSFHLDHDQTTALVEYFVGASQSQADSLATRLVEVHGWQAEAAKTKDPNATGNQWFEHPNTNFVTRWLSRFALRQKLIMAFDLNTRHAGDAAAARAMLKAAYDKIVVGADFLKRLFDVKYPFADAPHIRKSDERFERGKALVLELKCLACHVAGDPFVEGTTADIKAPNFALAGNRLRYDWIRQWLLNPQWIQPGTNMPQLFVDGNSAFKDYPDADKSKAEAEFGKTADEQIELIVDFLFDLGQRNATVVQPPAPAAPTPPAGEKPAKPSDDFESEFDEPAKDAGKEAPKKEEKPAKPDDDFQP